MYNIYDTTVEREHGQLLGYGGGIIGFFKKLIVECRKKGIATSITITNSEITEKLENAKTETERHQILINAGIGIEALAKKAFLDLLSDFCIYMEQSIQNAKDFKPQVALTLARRPLIDDVFYLMLLLCDYHAALQLIYENDSRKKDLRNLITRDKELCRRCLEIIGGNSNENLLFELRHGRHQNSIKASCDRAIHIATSNPTIRTHAGELNFVFMSQETLDYHMKMYCKLIPATLIYVFGIVMRCQRSFLKYGLSQKNW